MRARLSMHALTSRRVAAGSARCWCSASCTGLLLYRAGSGRVGEVLRSLLDDPAYEWLDVPAELLRESAERWLARFPDQRFTLADAVSFEVMRRRKVRQAFAYDGHFAVAGFEVVG
jgi:predicted nucleic acid-binding protein